jgi:hypothetical protein
MTMTSTPLIEGILSSFAELATASESLNRVSDALGKAVSDIDDGLRKLNLGIMAWVVIGTRPSNPPEYTTYRINELGYSKVGGKWGLALCTRSGDDEHPEWDESMEMWLFNDAPRTLRLSAINKLPELLKKLSEEATEVTKQLQAKLTDAQSIAAAVNPSVKATDDAPPVKGFTVKGAPPVKGFTVKGALPVKGFIVKGAPPVKGFTVKGQQTGPEVEK